MTWMTMAFMITTRRRNFNYFGPGNGDAYLISSGYSFRVFVRWDDWTAITQDFDLYIWRFDIDTSTWTMAGSGTNDQNGGAGQSPTEWAFATTTGTDAVYGFTIECYSCSRNVNFEVFAPKMASLDESLAARSLSNLADSPAAITVAALDVTPPYPQEYYSSEGPTNGPGGTAAGGLINRISPVMQMFLRKVTAQLASSMAHLQLRRTLPVLLHWY